MTFPHADDLSPMEEAYYGIIVTIISVLLNIVYLGRLPIAESWPSQAASGLVASVSILRLLRSSEPRLIC